MTYSEIVVICSHNKNEERRKVKMITKLTKKQESKFKYYVDKWINIGLNTDEVDMVASVLAVKKAYEVAKINPPKYFVGPVAGPYEAAIAEALVHMHVKNKTVFSNYHRNDFIFCRISDRTDRRHY